MESPDPMLQAAWEENLKLATAIERLRDDLYAARKCIADVTAIATDAQYSVDDAWMLIRERLDEYAGT
jgi:hypothetical protein